MTSVLVGFLPKLLLLQSKSHHATLNWSNFIVFQQWWLIFNVAMMSEINDEYALNLKLEKKFKNMKNIFEGMWFVTVPVVKGQRNNFF